MATNRTIPVAVLLTLGLLTAACGSGSGSMACSEYIELSTSERVEAFVEAVGDRGLRFTGPAWQVEMRESVVAGYCRQNPSATLDDGLDFSGVPRN